MAPMLLAIPGDNTYSNYQEANRAFWRQTVLPLGNRIGAALVHWLSPAFGAGLSLAVDLDKVETLSPDCAALWDRVTKAPFLTVNEKRAAMGYGALAGGDRLESATAVADINYYCGAFAAGFAGSGASTSPASRQPEMTAE